MSGSLPKVGMIPANKSGNDLSPSLPIQIGISDLAKSLSSPTTQKNGPSEKPFQHPFRSMNTVLEEDEDVTSKQYDIDGISKQSRM